jgi:hypothetical protein
MTTPRKRTSKKVALQQDTDVSTDTMTTYIVEVDTDPSVLYPPIRAIDAVGMDDLPSFLPRELPRWRQNLYYAPVVFGAILVAIAFWAVWK